MARTTYVLRGGELVEKYAAHPLQGGSAPHVISDTMPGIRSHADGKFYDSKSQYRQSLKAHGCIEVGNERAPFERRPEFNPGRAAPDIKAAIEQLRSK